MRALVVGGTRLLGSAVVRHLAALGKPVTVLSRKPALGSPAVTHVGMDRGAGLARLAGEPFDVVVDFLSYDAASAAEALARIPRAVYVMVSSVWMARLRPGAHVDAPIDSVDHGALDGLLPVTRRYLTGKCAGEAVVRQARASGRDATIVRMPIFLGEGDHTGRVEFYRRRLEDGRGVLCVDGGHNIAQVAWTEDLARALVKWLPGAASGAIWEGLAGPGLSVRELIGDIARGVAPAPSLIDVSSRLLAEHLPAYLEHEPLWRETALPVSPHNLFAATGMPATAPAEWLGGIRGALDGAALNIRAQELTLVEQLS